MAAIPPSHLYKFEEKGMLIKVRFTLCAARLEKLIR
jgi:hypothetical protein